VINHARTLLLNIASKSYQPGTLGEEYVPQYSPAALPTYLTTARKILLGTDPDKVFLNFRMHELLSFIHQTALGEFVYALDPRITYDTTATSEFFTAQQQINLRRVLGLTNTRLFLSGVVKADNITGRAYRNYFIDVTFTNGDYRLTVAAESTRDELVESLDWLQSDAATGDTSGLSVPVTLPNTALSVSISTPQVIPPVLLMEDYYDLLKEDDYDIELEPGEDPSPLQLRRMALTGTEIIGKWQLETYARPDSAITTCLPRLEFLGEPFYLELFGVGNTVEPYATFKNIWFDSKNPTYRLAAFVLAVIYRTDAIRKKQNG
jgi:hypothetical protein